MLISFSCIDGKTWVRYTFTYTERPRFESAFWQNYFFSLFKFQIPSEKHLFSIKNKEIIKKLWGRALLSQYVGIHVIIWIKIIIYTQQTKQITLFFLTLSYNIFKNTFKIFSLYGSFAFLQNYLFFRCCELECIFCTIQTGVPGAVFTDPVPTVQWHLKTAHMAMSGMAGGESFYSFKEFEDYCSVDCFISDEVNLRTSRCNIVYSLNLYLYIQLYFQFLSLK